MEIFRQLIFVGCIILFKGHTVETADDYAWWPLLSNTVDAVGGDIEANIQKTVHVLTNSVKEKFKKIHDEIQQDCKKIQLIQENTKPEEVEDFSGYLKFFAEECAKSRGKSNNYEKISNSGCQCSSYSCGCCAHVELAEIELNATVCANVTYLPQEYGMSFTMTVNNHTLYNETISVYNPPPYCVGAPIVKDLAEICMRLYDIQPSKTKLHACVRLEVRLKRILIAKYELGCFDIGSVSKKVNHSNIDKPTVWLL